ncbi:MAG: DUF4395 family protein [bacterium]
MIYNRSLRFSKTVYGILALIAFFIQSQWLIFSISVLMIFEIFSIKISIPYQFHVFASKKFFAQRYNPIEKESGELAFVCGLAGGPLFIGFLLLYFGKFIGFAWILILAIAFLLLLSGMAGLCVASLSYVIFKKIFNAS